ncbi:hypothetical protein AMECASPLE_018936 [Ameca splendens]|uniref:Secreted protein n=1 Tax=Ameca splendens TaxID=208324 RepID=A0ABV0ZPH6_9TELE
MTNFTFLLNTVRFVIIVFHIITAHSAQPDNESKGKKGKTWLFTQIRYQNCATTRSGSGGLAICPFWTSPGVLACLINYLKSYTKLIKQLQQGRRLISEQPWSQPERGSLVGVFAQEQVEAEQLNPD